MTAHNASVLLFDLDGTLTDPLEGVVNSILYALKKKGIQENHPEELRNFIGPPLHLSFQNRYHLGEAEAFEIVRVYREYYSEKGIFQNTIYPGIFDLLKSLKQQKKIISLATSKPTFYARQVVEYFKIAPFIDFIAGSNTDGSQTDKTEIVTYAKAITGNKPASEYLMIGDREFDIIGAHRNAIKTCWVGYGYGDEKIVLPEKPEYICPTVEALSSLLL